MLIGFTTNIRMPGRLSEGLGVGRGMVERVVIITWWLILLLGEQYCCRPYYVG